MFAVLQLCFINSSDLFINKQLFDILNEELISFVKYMRNKTIIEKVEDNGYVQICWYCCIV